MLISFFKLTFRNIRKQWFSSFVNITGLALGFATFILIALYVYDEMRHDNFHEQGDQIYRIYHNVFNPSRVMTNLPALLREPLQENIPEIMVSARLLTPHRDPIIEHKDRKFRQPGVVFTDPEVFEIFSFGIERGSLASFSENPQGVLITHALAKKLFDEEDPMGLTIRYKEYLELVVVGILEDIPRHSHIQADMLVNFEARRMINNHIFESWGNFSSCYYVLLRPDANPDLAGNKVGMALSDATNFNLEPENVWIKLQALKDIYLGSANIESSALQIETGNASTVYIFSISAVLILLLACFNYVNLASAKSTIRAREVGVRKVLGASRHTLIWYFLGESFLMTLVAALVGIGLVEMAGTLFSDISGKSVHLGIFGITGTMVVMTGLVIMVSLIAGLYPSLVMSGYKPVYALKGSASFAQGSLRGKLGVNLRFRQILIVLQFAVSIGLVAGSTILYAQTRYAMKNTGFTKEALVVIRNRYGSSMNDNYYRFRNDIKQYPFVEDVTAGLHVPGEHIGNQGYLYRTDETREEAQPIVFVTVDFNYFDVLGARMAMGRDFDAQLAADSTASVVLNQSAVQLLGLEEPIGTLLTGFWDGTPHKKVIGVVEDIHYQSAHRQVQPTAFVICLSCTGFPFATVNFLVQLNTTSLAEVVRVISDTWENILPGNPVDFFFLETHYNNMYRKELQAASTARAFTVLAIIIACMGLLGTTVYVMEARRKEFGVRKVLGASTLKLAGMISKEFTLLIILSNLIAWPVTWYLMNRWLDNFVYRINLSMWYFAAAGIIGLLLALITVNSLALRQAGRDPVQALKYE